MRIYLSNKTGYVLDPAPLSARALKESAVFKIGFKRYIASELENGTFLLKDQATAESTEAMLKRLKSSAAKLKCEIEIAGEVAEEINAKREYAEERFRAGTEIKAHDEKYAAYFSEFSTVVNDSFERPLRPRQMWDAFFMCAMGKSGNFSVPGSGKTASVLGAFAYLAKRGLASRVIVICPKNAFQPWKREFRACFGERLPLVAFDTQSAPFAGLPREERRRRLKIESSGCNLVLVNYEGATAYVDVLKDLVSRSALLVFDEVHRVKRVNGKWAAAALEVASACDRTVALTGTPIPNTYLDIYNFLHILFPREYTSFFNFSPAMLKNPSEYEISLINSKIQPFFCRTTKNDLGVPAPNPDKIIRISADFDTESILDVLKMRYRKNKLTLMLRVLQLETDPQLLLSDLDTSEYSWLLSEDKATGEIDYVDYSDEIIEMIERAPLSAKAAECASLVESLNAKGKPVIVWCVFVKSMLMLTGMFNEMGLRTGLVCGSTSQEERERTLDHFSSGEIDVLVTNPHTLAESVSLHSVCHDAIYYEYTFNLVHLLQSKDRIHRLGLPENQYTQYYFLQVIYDNHGDDYSLDANIYARLLEKESTMLNAIENHKLEIMPTTDDDLNAIFNGLFLDM